MIGQSLPGAGPLQIEPALPGNHRWINAHELEFTPSEPFTNSTRYVVLVDESALGTRLYDKVQFAFNTKMFEFNSVEPFYGAPNSNVRANVNFSHRIRPIDARASIKFFLDNSNGKPLKAKLQTKKPSRTMAFELEATRQELMSSAVEVIVNGKLGPVGGGTPLGKNVVRQLSIEAAPSLEVKNVWVNQAGHHFRVSTRFNAHVDPTAAAEYIEIEPKVKFTVSRGYRQLSLSGPFQPGQSYLIRFRKGLIAQNGNLLREEQTRSITTPDFSPSLSFEGQGNYLMNAGRKALNLKTVNIKRVVITVQKIYENNLAHVIPRLRLPSSSCSNGNCWEDEEYYHYYGSDSNYRSHDLTTMGPVLFSGEVPINSTKNQPVISAIPFSEIQSGKLNGVYKVRVADKQRTWNYAEKWMLATDIGLTLKSGPDEHRIQAVSLKTKKPLRSVTLNFISRTNIPYGTRKTDAMGVATLKLNPKLHKDPLSLVTARYGKDFSYLTVAANEVPVADFEVQGAGQSSSAYQAYVYLDRGLFRPGDKAHLTAIIRTKTFESPPQFPIQLEIRDPKWRLFKSAKIIADQDGAFTDSLSIPSDALTGDYAARIVAPNGDTIGRTKFKVEDFMPDRIKVEVKAKTAVSDAKTPVEYDVESAYLFGAPAGNLRLESRCNFAETSVRSKQYKGFPLARDSDADRAPRVNFNRNLSEATLDENGKQVQVCEFKSSAKPRRPVRATLFATVSENG